jgi:hypothetical protein
MRNPFSVLRGTYARWLAVNPILNAGEFGYDTDRKILKIGDGTSTWTLLQCVTMAYQEITGTTQACVNGVRYGANNSGLVTLTLPASAPIGMKIEIYGVGAGGWQLAQNALQSTRVGTSVSTVGITGYISGVQGSSVELMCVTANTGWMVTYSLGTITVV